MVRTLAVLSRRSPSARTFDTLVEDVPQHRVNAIMDEVTNMNQRLGWNKYATVWRTVHHNER